jgi:hypothetical protein
VASHAPSDCYKASCPTCMRRALDLERAARAKGITKDLLPDWVRRKLNTVDRKHAALQADSAQRGEAGLAAMIRGIGRSRSEEWDRFKCTACSQPGERSDAVNIGSRAYCAPCAQTVRQAAEQARIAEAEAERLRLEAEVGQISSSNAYREAELARRRANRPPCRKVLPDGSSCSQPSGHMFACRSVSQLAGAVGTDLKPKPPPEPEGPVKDRFELLDLDTPGEPPKDLSPEPNEPGPARFGLLDLD